MVLLSNLSHVSAIKEIIDLHIYNEDMKKLIYEFVEFKLKETSIWSKLTIYSHHMFGGQSPSIYYAAAQTELVILSLDILDDLQDEDHFDPPWMKYDRATIMNIASAILTSAIAGHSSSSIPNFLLQLITKAHNGQHKDISNSIQTKQQYIQLVEEKSSALISFAILMGYYKVENHNPHYYSLILQFAQNIGIAAQLENDMLNIDVLTSRNDIVQKKTTLTTLFLRDHSSEHFPYLNWYYENKCTLEQLLEHEMKFKTFVQSCGAIAYTISAQVEAIKKAEQLLQQIPTYEPYISKFRRLAIDRFLNKV